MQRLNLCFFAGGFILASLPHANAHTDSDICINEGFAPIRWAMSEAEIQKAFQGSTVTRSELEGTVVDEHGKRVPGKTAVITVKQYLLFGGILKGDISFFRRQHYQSISMDPGKGWPACEFVG